jgi:tetratricopeptide (TPR) repeat protein
VLRLDNNFSRALYLKAFTYKILEKYTDASNHFAEFIKKFPKDEMIVNAWAFKAYSENYLKKYDNALESCKNALDLAKGNTNKMTDKDTTWSIGLIFQEKGLALEGLEQYADAINCYKKFQPTDDNYSWVLKRIIKCLGKLGKISEQKVYRNKLKDFDSKKAN